MPSKNASLPLQNTATRSPSASCRRAASAAPRCPAAAALATIRSVSAKPSGSGRNGSSAAASDSRVASPRNSAGARRRTANSVAAAATARKSAPAAPSVRSATDINVETLGAGWKRRVCVFKISRRAFGPGNAKRTSRSNLPGRLSAGSTASGRLVAAITQTRPRESSPSINARSVATTEPWIASCAPPRAARAGASPSISSKKTMEGARLPASWKSTRRDRSASPMYLPSASAPLREKKETGCGPRAASATSARTAAVFPVPGGPCSSTPRPGATPSLANASGYVKGSNASSFNTRISRDMPARVSKPPRNVSAPPNPNEPPTVTHAVLFLSLTNRARSRAANAVSSSSKPSSFNRTRSPAATTERITPRVRSILDIPRAGRSNPISASFAAAVPSFLCAGGRPDALGAGPVPAARRSSNVFVRVSLGRAPPSSPPSRTAIAFPAAAARAAEPPLAPGLAAASPAVSGRASASASSPCMVLLQTGAGVRFWLLCVGHITAKRSALKRHAAACAHARWYVRAHDGSVHPTAAPFLPQCEHFSCLPRLIASSTCFSRSKRASKYTSGHHKMQFWCAQVCLMPFLSGRKGPAKSPIGGGATPPRSTAGSTCASSPAGPSPFAVGQRAHTRVVLTGRCLGVESRWAGERAGPTALGSREGVVNAPRSPRASSTRVPGSPDRASSSIASDTRASPSEAMSAAATRVAAASRISLWQMVRSHFSTVVNF